MADRTLGALGRLQILTRNREDTLSRILGNDEQPLHRLAKEVSIDAIDDLWRLIAVEELYVLPG